MKHGAAPARRVRVGRRSSCTRRAGAVQLQGALKKVGDFEDKDKTDADRVPYFALKWPT